MTTTLNSSITRVNSQALTHNSLTKVLKTTMMLKLLSRLFPGRNWSSQWLRENVKDSADQRCSLPDGRLTLTYKGQPGGHNAEHAYEITVHQSLIKELDQAYKAIQDISALVPVPVNPLPPNNKYNQYLKSNGIYEWNGIVFRSPPEIDIAMALEKKGVVFFANSKCRIRDRVGVTKTKESDFLVFHKGKVRILEVDGKEYHQQAHSDYARDRLFDKHGIRTTRYTASECISNPSEVLEEFLELFDSSLQNSSELLAAIASPSTSIFRITSA